MEIEKRRNAELTKLALPTSEAEKIEIEAFFDERRDLKKGETIKRWVLERIRRSEVSE